MAIRPCSFRRRCRLTLQVTLILVTWMPCCGVNLRAAEGVPGTTRAFKATLPGLVPATQPSGPKDIDQGLVVSLVQPYWQVPADRWRWFFRHSFVGKPFDVQKRDQMLSVIGRTVAEASNRSQLRVLILEQVGTAGQFGAYERIMLGTQSESTGEALPKLSKLGVIEIDATRWQPIHANVEEMLTIRGHNNGLSNDRNGAEATLLTYFDGKDWRIETWFSIAGTESLFLYDVTPATPQKAPPAVLAFARLLQHINTQLGPSVSFLRGSDLPSLLEKKSK